MDKLKRFIDCYIPTETCNLRCHYCYIALQEKFNNKIVHFTKTPEEIREALSIKRLGGICLFNFCAGGETLLAEEVIPVIRALLEEGHYLMVVTNGTLKKRFEQIKEFPSELLKRLFFKFSFHYLELKRLNCMDKYFENIRMMQNAGCSFTVEITPNDELIPYIDEIKQICMEQLGTLCHITIARDDRTQGIEVLSEKSWDEYKKIWGTFQSGLFDFKTTIFYKKRKEFCYAGEWSIYVNLVSGSMQQCYCGKVLDNIYEDINRPLHFEAIGNNCSFAHCYNGHAFLTLGDIPELDTVTYAEVRNRVNNEGKEWLQPEMKAFMSQKLSGENQEYIDVRKKKINRNYNLFKIKIATKHLTGRVKRIIKGKFHD